jgi:ATP-binding cassette subfamily G (WHITE) protein 2 (SNQ2)
MHANSIILTYTIEDIHSPTLTVAQTLGFAIKNKVASYVRVSGKGAVGKHIHELLDVFTFALGISHTKGTLVGNEFVRGVSGGERKRVSIGEVMAAQGSITCWDNSTRGLDASSALEFSQTLRTMADKSQATVIATLYQAGNGIFSQFNKILVLDDGRQIYYGPRHLAKAYFEDLGFVCPPGANIADFLTSVTVPSERQIKAGFENTPKTAEALEQTYHQSAMAQMMTNETLPPSSFEEQTMTMKSAVKAEKPKHTSPLQSSYTVSLGHQVMSCTIRQLHIMLGDKWSMGMQQAAALIMALITGSLYYNLPVTSAGLFPRAGALFYPVIFFNMNSMSEVTTSFTGRPILSRHRDFSLYRPTAFVIGRALTDIPNIILQVSVFSIIFYFMTGFQVDAGKFFTFWILTTVIALCFTQMYRMIGSLFQNFDNASKISGFWTMAMMVYAGYFIPQQNMHPWFGWIVWLNPAAYGYEGLMANEFEGLNLACVGDQLVPNGPSYSNSSHRACTVMGSAPGSSTIIGSDYIYDSYRFSHAHLWRNFGIIIAWWIAYLVVTAVALELNSGHDSGKSSLTFKRGAATKSLQRKGDVEQGSISPAGSSSTSFSAVEIPEKSGLVRNEAVFTWDHLSYTVSVPGGKRKLLDDITGWVKPGQLGALMGSSGAGKTTLLDVLAQRKDVGVIEGKVLVDGRPLPTTFQRSAGYCEQMDVHEGTATVRESLIFSARLRQPRDVPDAEKISYVEKVIELLELEDIQDAIIGVPGRGLTVEQRKRVTIGVELAAKPSILLFLDEPTSGLDGQSAFNVIRFLRKLTAAGQAILCTIHQPSAALFESFDMLLLLAKGGKTVYFGETGTNSSILLDYFTRNGSPCGPDINPAEHIIDVVSGASGGGRDWNSIWSKSPEQVAVVEELARIKATCLAKPSAIKDDHSSFATPLLTQLRLVTQRQQVALWRNPDYVWNKIFLHVSSALFAGFTFWMIGNSVADLQLRLLAVFNFIFVSVGVIYQLQPLFLHYRDIFEAREKKSKMYSWIAFVTAQLVAEIPYLVICGTLYFACWYFTTGLPVKASISGQIYFTMILYEFLYTSIGQAIAAISPNEFFASLLNPVLMSGFLVNFAGVLVPYTQIVSFWKYWMYWLDPFTYLVGGLLTKLLYDVEVTCADNELISFSPPQGQTCGQYMTEFFQTGSGYLVDNSSTTICDYCQYASGSQYAATLNLTKDLDGWRDASICPCTGRIIY